MELLRHRRATLDEWDYVDGQDVSAPSSICAWAAQQHPYFTCICTHQAKRSDSCGYEHEQTVSVPLLPGEVVESHCLLPHCLFYRRQVGRRCARCYSCLLLPAAAFVLFSGQQLSWFPNADELPARVSGMAAPHCRRRAFSARRRYLCALFASEPIPCIGPVARCQGLRRSQIGRIAKIEVLSENRQALSDLFSLGVNGLSKLGENRQGVRTQAALFRPPHLHDLSVVVLLKERSHSPTTVGGIHRKAPAPRIRVRLRGRPAP